MPEALDPLLFGPDQMCFGCGPHNDHGMRLKFERDDDTVVTTYHPQPGQEGPPGILHGGLQATLLDEIAAWTVLALQKKMAFTSTLNVRLMRPVRVASPVRALGTLKRERNGLFVVSARLEQGGRTAARAQVTLRALTQSGAERLMGRAIPPQWRSYCVDAPTSVERENG